MNKEKLDKIIDIIFQEVGELRDGFSGHEDFEGYYGLLDNDGKLLAYGRGVGKSGDFFITDNFPLLYMLKTSLDPESFEYIINTVANKLVKLYISNRGVEYSEYKGGSTYKFKYTK